MTSPIFAHPQSNSLPIPPLLRQTAAVADASQKLQSQLRVTQDSLSLTSQALAGGKGSIVGVGETARNLGNTLRGANQLQNSINDLAGGAVPAGMLRAGQAATSSILPFTDVAGALSDVARAQTRALDDFAEMQRVLTNPASSSALRIAVTARATQSASVYIRRQHVMLESLDAADTVLLAKNPTYARLTQDTRQMKGVRAIGRMSSTTMTRLMKAAEVGGSAAGLTLSAIALPQLVSAVGTSYRNLHAAFRDDAATEDQRLGAVADLGRATASSIHAVEGMRLSFSTLSRVAANSRLLGNAVTKVAGTRMIRFSSTVFGRAMGVLMPIADVGLFAANGVKAWQTLKDPGAGFGAKARSIVAVGLDGLKLATYLMPMTQGLRMAYLGASIASIGLSTWDFGRAMMPAARKLGAAFVEAVMDPMGAVRKVANAAEEGVMSVVRAAKTAATAIWNALSHPAVSYADAKDKVSDLVAGGRDVAETLGEAVRLVDRKAGEGIMTMRRKFGGRLLGTA